jgi:hypothetical protein
MWVCSRNTTFVPTIGTPICARVMNHYPYSRDLRPWSHFAPLFLYTPATFVQAHAMNLYPSLQGPSSALAPCTFVPYSKDIVCACATSPYCPPPLSLIPLVKEINTLESLLVSTVYNMLRH